MTDNANDAGSVIEKPSVEGDGEHQHGSHDHGHGHDHLVIVKVDGHPHHVEPGTYLVSDFKKLVGVAADRELDIVKDGVLDPLNDNAEITIHGHEVFVSHVRTGGSG